MVKFQVFEQPAPKFPHTFHSSKDVFNALKDYGKADREIFLIVTVNAKNRMLDCIPISAGTLDQAAVYVREVVKAAIVASAASIILVHNHPSGDPDPSSSDKTITQAIQAACQLFEIKVLDHVILGLDSYYSLADNGIIEEVEHKIKEYWQMADSGQGGA